MKTLKHIGLLLLVVGFGGALVVSALSLIPRSGEQKYFAIKAKKFEYTPNIIEVNKGDYVTIRMVSEDVHHGFYLDGYELEMSAVPGKDGSLSFVADRSGRYSFRCSVTCGEFHPYMIGHLKVLPDYRLQASLFGAVGLFGMALFFVGRRTPPTTPRANGTEQDN